MEERKNSKTWLVVLAILLICAGIAVFVPSLLSKTEDTKKDEGVVVKEKNEISPEVKAKLERWVGIASAHSSIDPSTSTLEKFAKGMTELDAKTKLVMTYNAVMSEKKIYDQNSYELTAEDVKAMESTISKSQISEESVKIMKISDFNKTYEELFQETASYTLKDLDFGCPIPWGMDKAKDRIYLFERCGGVSPIYSDKNITSYYESDGYYCLVQEAEIKDGSEKDKVTESYKILWKFDKNLKFVSSEKE